MNKRERKKWRKKNGTYVNPKDTWCLDITIAEFILPRLKLFKKVNNGYPGVGDMNTPEKWDEALDKMILAFQLIVDDDKSCPDISNPNWKEIWDDVNNKIDEGLLLFAKWNRALWW